MQTTTLKNFVNIYLDSQEFRIKAANRLRESDTENKEYIESQIKELESSEIEQLDEMYVNGSDFSDNAFSQTCFEMIRDYRRTELNIVKVIEKQFKREEYATIAAWLRANTGIGTVLAAGLIAYVEPVIDKLTYAQSLHKYAGYAVVNTCQTCGKRHEPESVRGRWIIRTAERLKEQNDKLKDKSKKKKGADFIKEAESKLCTCENPVLKAFGQRRFKEQMADFNPVLKKICYLVSDQFIKQRNSPYRKIYDESRAMYENRADLKKEMEDRKSGISKGTAHIDMMARRRTVKLFLSHFWEVFRTIRGLQVQLPYAIAVLGHGDYIAPYVKLEDVCEKVGGKWVPKERVRVVVKAKAGEKVKAEAKEKVVKGKKKIAVAAK